MTSKKTLPKSRKASPKETDSAKSVTKRKSTSKQSVANSRRLAKRSWSSYLVIGGLWGTFFMILMGGWFAYDLPSISKLADRSRQPSMTILARDGQTITTVGAFYGAPVNTEMVPQHVVNSFLATEDRRFFSHFGIDLFGLLRAFIRNIVARRVVQGGSTITQQLAKNFLLTQGLYTYQDRSLRRKIQEVILSLWLEVKFTKHQILTIYLNRVYFGSGAFGLGAAAEHYFAKSAKNLTVHESAMLAGLLKAPSKYSPFRSQEAARKRTGVVLKAMLDAAYIDDQTYMRLKTKSLQYHRHGYSNLFARYFVDWVTESVPEKIGQVSEDLIITTTLDIDLQRKAEQAVKSLMADKGASLKASQASLVSMTPSGSIRSMVGGVEYARSQYNRATQANRQSGSLFKLFVYLVALEKGFHPNRKISDRPYYQGKWSPKNYGWRSRGDISFQDGFAYSVNTVSVRLAKFAGIKQIQNKAYELGITSAQPNDLTIALGSGDATLMELTGAYAHVANDGFSVDPYGIVHIKTRSGKVVYQHQGQTFTRVISHEYIESLKEILSAVMEYGTGRQVTLKDQTCYGKSGTSQNYQDAWFVGFTDDLVTGVWCGNDDNSPMNKVTGAKLPGKIWQTYNQSLRN